MAQNSSSFGVAPSCEIAVCLDSPLLLFIQRRDRPGGMVFRGAVGGQLNLHGGEAHARCKDAGVSVTPLLAKCRGL